MDSNILENLKSWPWLEAKKLQEHTSSHDKEYIMFEAGYGPSGPPHLGTFAEVFRTVLVKNSFEEITGRKSKLIVFSDDMDGLRKIPKHVPNQQMLEKHLGKPLSSIPDPYGTHASYADHMNTKLKEFLGAYNFDYQFMTSTECYKSGKFDQTLLLFLKHFDDIMKVMLPTLGEERQATYSPFLPICPETGVVLQVPIVEKDVEKGTISYHNNRGELVTTLVTGGHCKMQWKADWALRWIALGIDYEMHGKDLIPSASLTSNIVHATGHKPPLNFRYELFLDEHGKKISKSVGNGLSVEEWLKYGSIESLATYLFQSPHKAKRLYFDMIPKSMDEYVTYMRKYYTEQTNRQDNPLYHINKFLPIKQSEYADISFSMLLNLASACNPENKQVLWGFIAKYDKSLTPEKHPLLDQMAEQAILYYNDFVLPNKHYRKPVGEEKEILNQIRHKLKMLESNGYTEHNIQNMLYDIAVDNQYDNIRDFFAMLYEVLLGQQSGPRLGSFIYIYGTDNFINLLLLASDDK